MANESRINIKRIYTVCCLPAAVIIMEFLLRTYTGQSIWQSGLLGGLLMAVAVSLICEGICALFSPQVAYWLRLAFMEFSAVWFLFAFFIYDSFTVFMNMGFVLGTADSALSDFGRNIGNVFTKGLPIILVYHLPVAAYLLLRRFFINTACVHRVKESLCLFIAALLCFGAGHYAITGSSTLRTQYYENTSYDSTVKSFGLISALVQQWELSVFGNEESISGFSEITPVPAATPAETSPADIEATPEPEKTYLPNVMDIDFESISGAQSGTVASISKYVMSREPTMQNEYTGMFEGKNLILITAEAFSKEVIDRERTPALYRMATRGIVFEDFYQPVWGGGTSTGEYSWLTGLMPASTSAMLESANANLYFTMGNQLKRLGYFSAAYHNGTYDYYSRNTTHCNLGYSTWTAIGNGLDLPSYLFPASDLDMFNLTIPEYINEQPFSIYYMTISGHAGYAFSDQVNDMSVKNKSVTEDLPYSESVRAYLACNQELEYGLESMLQQLEDAGILDDTVIVIVPDHYPYGLMPSSAWGTTGSKLAELYGYEPNTYPKRDHNAAIIWCSCMEDEEPVTVSGPTSSLDILPTLSNLFGLEYDSRLLAGQDALSGASPLVFWTDGDFLTDLGYYECSAGIFTPTSDDIEVSEDYIEYWKSETSNRMKLSRGIQSCNYYGRLFD